MRTIQKEPGKMRKMKRGGPSYWLCSSRSIWIMRRQMRAPWTMLPRKNSLLKVAMPNRPIGAGPRMKCASWPMPSARPESRGRNIIIAAAKNMTTGEK